MNSIYFFAIEKNRIVDATKKGNYARFINHSCNPNTFSAVNIRKGRIFYYALRDIKPGEELTIDYNISSGEDQLLCNCQSEQCRKTYG